MTDNTKKVKKDNNESMYGNPYMTKEMEKELLHVMNKDGYEMGLITYDIYMKTKADIERL